MLSKPIPRQPRYRPKLNLKSNQAKGLVLWYPLNCRDVAATTQLDCSGKGTNVTTGWSATQNSIVYMPNYGYGMALGSTGFARLILDHGTMDSLAGGPITIAFWYCRTGTIASASVILGCNTSSTGGFALAAAQQNSNNLAYFPGTTGLGTLTSNHWFDLGVRSLNTTEHHCIIGNGAILTHYVNGVVVNTWTLSGTQAQPTTHTGVRYFGANNSGASPAINLTLADLRIYNRALSDLEVLSLYDPETRFELFEQNTPQIYYAPQNIIKTDIARKRISSQYVEILGTQVSIAQVTREYMELLHSNNLSQSDLAYLEILQPIMSAHQLGKIYLETIMEHVPGIVTQTIRDDGFWVGEYNPQKIIKY